MILRLNDDGTTPADNPVLRRRSAMGGEVGANIQKIYSYGHRNGFGMAFDPYSGVLWETENADDAFSELNRVIPGMNGGWIQIAGPLSRFFDFKLIEANEFGSALQQVRYPADAPGEYAGRREGALFMLPGATYVDPELSWKYEIGPAGTTFVRGTALGAEYDGTLWIGSSARFQQVGGNGGSLYRLKLTRDRQQIDVVRSAAGRSRRRQPSGPKFEATESETLRHRHGLRHHAGHRAGARRQSLRRFDYRQRDLQDQPQVETILTRSQPLAATAPCTSMVPSQRPASDGGLSCATTWDAAQIAPMTATIASRRCRIILGDYARVAAGSANGGISLRTQVRRWGLSAWSFARGLTDQRSARVSRRAEPRRENSALSGCCAPSTAGCSRATTETRFSSAGAEKIDRFSSVQSESASGDNACDASAALGPPVLLC